MEKRLADIRAQAEVVNSAPPIRMTTESFSCTISLPSSLAAGGTAAKINSTIRHRMRSDRRYPIKRNVSGCGQTISRLIEDYGVAAAYSRRTTLRAAGAPDNAPATPES